MAPKNITEEQVKRIRALASSQNSINKAIKVMKNSGIDAKSVTEEDENCIKYIVTIPKNQKV